MAALTRSGARKASEIVMFTFRTLPPSRPAMLLVFAVGSAMSSSRPKGLPATPCRWSASPPTSRSGRSMNEQRERNGRSLGLWLSGRTRAEVAGAFL
jgi:hypothetical protein